MTYKLPSADALAKEFGINRLTVQRAVHRLVEKGILTTYRGKGTFVLTDAIQYPKMVVKTKLAAYMSFADGTVTKLLKSERCGSEVSDRVPEAERAGSYQRLVRVQSKEQGPYAFTEIFLASEVYDIQPDVFDRSLLIRTTLATVGRENIKGIHQTWTIRKASKEVAGHLNISVGDPVAKVFRTIHNKQNIAIFIGNIIYPGHIVEFESEWDLD